VRALEEVASCQNDSHQDDEPNQGENEHLVVQQPAVVGGVGSRYLERFPWTPPSEICPLTPELPVQFTGKLAVLKGWGLHGIRCVEN